MAGSYDQQCHSSNLTVGMMKNFLISIGIGFLLFTLIPRARVTYGMDVDGCLTCHKYPGLVRLEHPHATKILHIDETKYLQGAHGKLNCRDCHPKILQVPHTGITDVDCSTKCHLKEKQSIRSKIVPLSAYHRREQSYITRLDSNSACNTCHSIYPHSHDKTVRALLNMHTGFTLCEVCHLDQTGIQGLFYGWKDPEEVSFSGEPFGSFFKPGKDSSPSDDHLISRIAAYSVENGKARMVDHRDDVPKAEEFLRKEKQLGPAEKARQMKYFHRDVAKKEISVACNGCHSENSILDFQKLGFDKNKTHNLKTLGIKGLVTKYKTFYFPHLFDQ